MFLWPPLGQRRPTLVLSACRYESPGILSAKLVLAFVVVHRTNRKDLRIRLHLAVFHYKLQQERSAKMEQDENERSPLFYSPLIRRSVLITFLKTSLLPCESLTLKVGAHPLLLRHLADYGFPYFQDFYKRIAFKSQPLFQEMSFDSVIFSIAVTKVTVFQGLARYLSLSLILPRLFVHDQVKLNMIALRRASFLLRARKSACVFRPHGNLQRR